MTMVLPTFPEMRNIFRKVGRTEGLSLNINNIEKTPS